MVALTRHRLTYMVLLPLAVALVAVEGSAPADRPEDDPLSRFSADERALLEKGEPVFEYVRQTGPGQGDSGHGRAAIIINAPVEVCFKIFSDLEKQHEYFPRKTMSEVVGKKDNQVLLHNQFDFYLATVEYTSCYTIDEKNLRFDFEMDKSYPHNIPESAGYFVFEKIDDGRTLFTYAATRLEVGVRVPEFVKEYITSRDLPAQAVNVKKRIESGGKWIDK